MSKMLEDIRQYLLGKGFQESKNEKEQPTFTKEFDAPRRQLIINGQKVEEAPHKMNFVITSLGEGKMWNAGDEPEELQGFNMADNDIWVHSLEDFKFWSHRIFE